MAYVTLKCPDCGKETVFNGRGRCVCGTYLIGHWQGMNRGSKLVLPPGKVAFVPRDKDDAP